MTSSTTRPLRAAVLLGSVRRPRTGPAVLHWFVDVATAEGGWDLDVLDLAEIDLPLHDTPPGGNGSSPIAARLARADAFVVITPEYNHSFPAVIKNVIDWHYHEWSFKPVTFVSYGAGSGGIRAVEQLRLIFPELYSLTTRNTVALAAPWSRLDADGAYVAPEAAVDAAHATLRELAWWARALRDARLAAPYDS